MACALPDDSLPRSSLAEFTNAAMVANEVMPELFRTKVYNSALDDIPGIDLTALETPAPRLERHNQLTERNRATKSFNPKELPSASVQPAASPRTRIIAQLLEQSRPKTKGNVFVKVKKPMAEALSPRSRPKSADLTGLLSSRPQSARAAAHGASGSSSSGGTGAGAPSAAAAGPASARPKTANVKANLESAHARLTRMNALLADELKKTDEFISARRAELNGYRELSSERQKELELLQGEYAVLAQKHAVHTGDMDALHASRDALRTELENTEEQLAQTNVTNTSCALPSIPFLVITRHAFPTHILVASDTWQVYVRQGAARSAPAAPGEETAVHAVVDH